jgi:hypothetical protein
MADRLPQESPARRPGVATGPAMAALVTLSACSAQGAGPRVDLAQLTAPVAAVVSPLLQAPATP